MKLRPVYLVLLIIWSLELNNSTSYAISAGYTDDPLKISIGARQMGMGGAMAAISDGASSIFNNPASMAGQKVRLTSMYTSLLGDVNYTIMGGSWPINLFNRQGSMGIGLAGSSVAGLIDPDPTGFKSFDYHNNVWMLAYGEKIDLFNHQGKIALRLKYFDEGFTGSQTDYGKGYNLDAGLIFTLWEKTDIGLMVQNFLLSSLGGKVIWASGGEESIPKQLRMGIASRRLRSDVLLAADVDTYANRPAYPARIHAGVEWQVMPAFSLRLGLDNSNPTFGTGLKIGQFVFDYAYHPYFGFSDITTHYFSLSFIEKEVVELPKKVVEAPKTIALTPEVITPALKVIVTTPEVISSAEKFKPSQLKMSTKRVFHYVSKGETLRDILLKYYGTTKYYKKFAALNGIKNIHFLLPGKYLIIPPKEELEKQ